MTIGPCLCGDIFCSSCGPAQGNTLCPYCGHWSADDDENVNVVTGCLCTPEELAEKELALVAAEEAEYEASCQPEHPLPEQDPDPSLREWEDGFAGPLTQEEMEASDFAYDAARERGSL